MCRNAIVIFFIYLMCSISVAASQPTFADLAVLLAKGYFQKQVPADASLEECASFLNSKGICFTLFELMDPDLVVTREDCARVVGQSTLLFLGEATVVDGCIALPVEMESWLDYCLLNEIQVDLLWDGLLQRMENGSVPEVKSFFGK